ncbi:MAG: MTH938/NDUFAF3 family protein [Candidatus Njordarchaeales archaeon]
MPGDSIETGFGWIRIKETKFSHDVVIDPEGRVYRRPKELSASKKSIYGHTPLTREEVLKILEIVGDIDLLVIGTGQYGKLPIEKEALEELRKRGVKVITSETPKAISRYLEVKDKYKVASLFHVTC